MDFRANSTESLFCSPIFYIMEFIKVVMDSNIQSNKTQFLTLYDPIYVDWLCKVSANNEDDTTDKTGIF